MLERILREAGVPELIDVLVERLAPTDLQSLLLESYRRRVVAVKPSQLLERYERDRFVRPSHVAPLTMADFDRLVWSLLPDAYTPVELSPVCPLGTNAAVATVDQNNVVTTIRNTEVVADATNVLALECASRRRRLLRADPRNRERVRLCTSHRVVRGSPLLISSKVGGSRPSMYRCWNLWQPTTQASAVNLTLIGRPGAGITLVSASMCTRQTWREPSLS